MPQTEDQSAAALADLSLAENGSAGTVPHDDDCDDHCSREVIAMLKETLNYHSGDHFTFFVFGASGDLAVKKIYPTLW